MSPSKIPREQAGAQALRPMETVTRFFLSSPAYFISATVSDDYLLTLAYSQESHAMRDTIAGNAHSKNYFVLSCHHEPWNRKGIVAPSYRGFASLVCDVAAVWYGKQFKLHGEFESLGHFSMPDLRTPTLEMPSLGPYNQRARPDLAIELRLDSLHRPLDVLLAATEDIGPVVLAAHYYNRALRTFNGDVEAAYLHLVSALEILAEQIEIPDEQLYDERLREHFAVIASLESGDRIVSDLKSRLFQLRRRVACMGRQYVGPRLFEGTESVDNHAPLRSDRLDEMLKAAYDVRSRHLHAGTRFGGHVTPHANVQNEGQLGRPVLDHDPGMATALAKAPTFLGLERITRFVILRFIHMHIGPIHDVLAVDSPSDSDASENEAEAS